MKNYSKLQPLQLYVRKRYTVCINILLDLWPGLGIDPRAHPRPRLLHMYVHFAGQIDKKTLKHNTPSCSLSLRGSTHRNLEVIKKKATYLIYQYFQSVQCCHCKSSPNIKLIDTCGSRLITSRQLLSIQSLNLQLIATFFIIKIWFLLILVVMCSHSHQASDESCMQEINVQYLPSTT